MHGLIWIAVVRSVSPRKSRKLRSVFADMRASVYLLTLAGVITSGSEAWSDDRAAAKLVLGVEHALPLVGKPCRLWLASDSDTPLSQQGTVSVTFQIDWVGRPGVSSQLPAAFERGRDRLASTQWVPRRTGACRLRAKVIFRHKNGKAERIDVSPLDVFVTTRTLHFNYWQSRSDQRFVTSVMDNRETHTTAVQWKRRGVRPLDWKGGQWHWSRGYDSPEKMAAFWAKMARERVGIVIDEFGGGDPVDQQLGAALSLVRSGSPTMFLAPYCLSVNGEKMIAGMRQANLVLVETYTSDWRWDGFITGRWQTAVDAGLTKKSISVLGLGSQWIGTERELRRVFRMVRATCPEMPGIGFFPEIPPRLTKAVDSAIEDYFLRPVVEVRSQGRRFTVRNLGESLAADVEVEFLGQDGKRLPESKRISRLAPWKEFSGELPSGATTAKIQPAPARYTTLAYTPPLKLAKPGVQQQNTSLRFRQSVLNGEVVNPFTKEQKLTVVRTDDNHVRSAFISIPDTEGAAIALSFDVHPDRCWFYGHNSVSLVGDGELTLTWARQDHDAGLDGNQPRPTLIFKGKDGYTVREVPTMGFREKETFHILMVYDGHQAVRVIVTDQQKVVLWDSGPLPAKGGFCCNKLRFDVNPFERSEIRADTEKATVFLRGGNGVAESPYLQESTLSKLRVVVPASK